MNLANLPNEKQGKAQCRGDEVFMAVEIALDSLDLLRSFIMGSPFEIEILRWSFVQHLHAWQRHLAALEQCRKNFASLCLKIYTLEKGSSKQGLGGAVKGRKCAGRKVAASKRSVKISVLPHPQDVELTVELPRLVIGVVINLIRCTSDSAPTSSESYRELLPLPQQLEPWLMTLDADVAGRLKDDLTWGLYKCARILVANPGHYLVREFAMITLQTHATGPSSWKQYLKVAHHLSCCLSSHGATYIRLALELSETAMKGSLLSVELQSLWTDTAVLDIVHHYSTRLCSTNKYSAEGGAYLCDLVYRIRQLSPPVTAILGFYAVGLKFHGEAVDVDEAILDLLGDGATFMESCLQQETDEDKRKYTCFFLRAFVLANRNVLQYTTSAWGSLTITRDTVTTVESEAVSFKSTLQRVLHLWCLLLSRASDYRGLTTTEKLVVKQGWSVAYAPMALLLQLSMASLQGLKDSVACVDDLLKRGKLRIYALEWIMARAFNLGVVIFNSEDYESACLLFRVSYDAGWAMAEAGMMKPADYQGDDLNLDKCSKYTLSLASSLRINGKYAACIETIEDGLLRWATIHSSLICLATSTPGHLVQERVATLTPVRLVQARINILLEQEYESLNSFIKAKCQALHQQTIDLLLEEESLYLQKLVDDGVHGIALQLQVLVSNSSSASKFVSVPRKTMGKVLEAVPNFECTLCNSKFSEKRKRGCMVPCGHASACFDCATKARERKPNCPWCQAHIEELIPLPRIYF